MFRAGTQPLAWWKMTKKDRLDHRPRFSSAEAAIRTFQITCDRVIVFPRLMNDFWSFWNAWTKLRKSKRRSLPHLFYSDGPTDCLFAALCAFRWALICSRFASRHGLCICRGGALGSPVATPGISLLPLPFAGESAEWQPAIYACWRRPSITVGLTRVIAFVMLTHYTSASFLCAPQYHSTP